jgi:ABC-type uncharacterized transport system fused permease/ATPase subunit
LSRTDPQSDPNRQRPFAITGLRQVLRDAWSMTHPYWFSEDRWAARGLLLAVIVLNLAIVYINVLLNKWNNTFYDDSNGGLVGVKAVSGSTATSRRD